MPSFEGMDPYLEGSLWTSFHFAFGAEIVRQLAPILRPRYVALPVERFVIEIGEDAIESRSNVYPDVAVIPTRPIEPISASTAVMPAPLQLSTIMPTTVPDLSIEIRDAKQRRLVTTIEILSPTNKRGAGYEEYLLKRQRLLLSSAHLMEIDLLRRGHRVPMQQPLPEASYFIFVSRAEQRPLTDVWPIALSERLPAVPVPLLPGDDDVPLDLQAAFDATYELIGFDLLIDYEQPPDVPLSEVEQMIGGGGGSSAENV